MAQTRTMAFQISEDLFQRIKDYLAHENERQGRKAVAYTHLDVYKRQLESQALGAGRGFFQRQFLTAVITVILYIHPRSLLLDRTIVPDDNG